MADPPSAATNFIEIVSPAEAVGVEPDKELHPVVAEMVTCDPGANAADNVHEIVVGEFDGFVISWK